MCDTSFYTVSDFPKSVYCQSECDLLMDGLLHFQLKPHNANPATRRAIFSLATWQIADTHKNCANTCNCPKIFVQIRSIVCEYETRGNPEIATFSQTLQGDWKTMKKQHENLWDGIEEIRSNTWSNPVWNVWWERSMCAFTNRCRGGKLGGEWGGVGGKGWEGGAGVGKPQLENLNLRFKIWKDKLVSHTFTFTNWSPANDLICVELN